MQGLELGLVDRNPSSWECLELAVEIHLAGKILKDGNGLYV